ncbi:MAG TPA: M3 family oligoendopeptidase [Candidatus Dormibacteraeota bacterium]
MTTLNLPDSPAAFRDASLEEIVGYFRDLAEQPLTDVEAWLQEWSRLTALVEEAVATALIEYDRDTGDAEKERVSLRLASEVAPALEEWYVTLGQRLVESGYSSPDLDTTIARFRNRIELFRESNVPLVAETERLGSEYRKVVGAMTVQWEGQQLTPPQVRPFANSGDRQIRERGWRAYFEPYIGAHDELAAIYDKLLAARRQMAVNAGFANYRDYGHQQLNRVDYTPDDCLRFHEGVEATVVPAVERIYQRRAAVMGLDSPTILPWDAIDNHVAVPDPKGLPPVRPFATQEELEAGATRVFTKVDPVLGEFFQRLVDGNLLDLMSRPGKAPGAYCSTLPVRKAPFLFENASGLSTDVDTLLHEAGHAFHAYEVVQELPLVFQWEYGAEIAEVASMGMELLARPYLRKRDGGFYSEEDYRRVRISHLEEVLVSLAHIASVDAFQQWVYTEPEPPDAAARDQKWLELRSRFERGVDWTGCEPQRIARWYEQSHFFLYPLYYIEYGIAQFGALQVWRNAIDDQAAAVRAYRKALALGGTRSLPELYAAAGAELVFDAGKMAPLVDLVEREVDRLGG